MKTIQQIGESIKDKFFKISGIIIDDNTVIDNFVSASASGIEGAYLEIESSKNPHIYTKLKDEDLDKFGYLVNCERETDESDQSYLYRIMSWKLRNESSNITAIDSSLINLKYASDAKYIPFTNGCGTGTVFIVPKNYDEETRIRAIEEVQEIISKVTSPSSYIDYIIPTPQKVSFIIQITTEDGDLSAIQNNIEIKIKEHINSIAPGDALYIGDINKIGVNEAKVTYFNVSQININNNPVSDYKIIQLTETKLMFDDIIWWTGGEI